MAEIEDISSYKMHSVITEFKLKLKSASKLMRCLNMALLLLMVSKMAGNQKDLFYKVTLPFTRHNDNIIFATDYDLDAQSNDILKYRRCCEICGLLQQAREKKHS